MTIHRCTPAGTWAAVLLVLLSGCLPYSCRREESTALMPADSASRQIAALVEADTLEHLWSVEEPLDYPRTVRFGAVPLSGPDDGAVIFVGDVERNALLSFDETGALQREVSDLSIPYVAGVRNDTVAVFSADAAAVHFLVDGQIARSISIEDPDRSNRALLYAAYGKDLFYKRVDETGVIARVDRRGRMIDRYPLPGPQWRHAGLLRMWGDTLVSLSGYRPVADLLAGKRDRLVGDTSRQSTNTSRTAGDTSRTAGDSSPRLDTLALQGFDSPMLARSRAFMLGDVTEAPLLTSSAAPAGDLLFVLNMRAGWLQVDVFDREGRLQNRLVERDQAYQKSFFPQDIDVRKAGDGTYQIVVVVSEPSPQLRLYAWTGE